MLMIEVANVTVNKAEAVFAVVSLEIIVSWKAKRCDPDNGQRTTRPAENNNRNNKKQE